MTDEQLAAGLPAGLTAGATSAPEGRQNVAHGVSRGDRDDEHPFPSFVPAPAGATECTARTARQILSPLPGLGLAPFAYPRLTSWATFCRRSAAEDFAALPGHLVRARRRSSPRRPGEIARRHPLVPAVGV